jgi:opacity protein-like surface antigen
MRNFFLMILLAGLFAPTSLCAQNYYYNNKYYENNVVLELGGSFGVMNSLTDLGGRKGKGKKFIKDLNWKNAKPAYGAYLTAMYRNVLGVRLEATFGEAQAYDSILKKVRTSTFGRYERNLSFKSKINDFQLGVEFHPLFIKEYDDGEYPLLSPYILGGVGFFSFDPQAKLNGQWYALQPLRLEGQGFKEYRDRKPYNLTQMNFNVGAGVRYEISSLFSARLELNYRILQTDYLDDASTDFIDPNLFDTYLSTNLATIAKQLYNRKWELGDAANIPVDQRGDPKDNDAFFTIQLKLGITLGRQKR